MDRLPPLAALHAFALVLETGSLAAAAARLNVTQPAISRRVRELEAALGVALLRRGANAVVPTEAGARYAAALREAFGAIRAATVELGAGPAAPLRVRAYTTWALRWLIPRLKHFRALHPGLEIEVLTSTAPVVDFARDGLDAAIRSGFGPPLPGAVRLHPVMLAGYATPAALRRDGPAGLTRLGSRVRPGDWGVWERGQRSVSGQSVAPPPQPSPASGGGGIATPAPDAFGVVPPASQGREPFTPMPPPPRAGEGWGGGATGKAGSAPTDTAAPLLFESTSLAIQAALEGLGAVICPPAYVTEELRRRRLKPLPGKVAATGEDYWLMLPPGRARPEAAAFRDWLVAEAARESG